jgi:TRAP-type C4-dicarboxylate transport system substrate-binding protein
MKGKGKVLLIALLLVTLFATGCGNQALNESSESNSVPKEESPSTETTSKPVNDSKENENKQSKETNGKEYDWNLVISLEPSHYATQALNELAEEVKKKSNGALEITVHPGGSLLKQGEEGAAIIGGQIEMDALAITTVSDIMPSLSVLSLPFMTSSLEEHKKASKALMPFYNDVLNEKGLVGLATFPVPSQHIFSSEPIRTVDDWKGKVTRIYNIELSELVKLAGGSPVKMSSSEIYTALERNTLDAFITSNPNIPQRKLHEVTKYANQWSLTGAINFILVVNEEKWNELPSNLQNTIEQAVKDTDLENKLWAATAVEDQAAIEEMKEHGMEIVYPSAEERDRLRKLTAQVWKGWSERNGEKAQEALRIAEKALK